MIVLGVDPGGGSSSGKGSGIVVREMPDRLLMHDLVPRKPNEPIEAYGRRVAGQVAHMIAHIESADRSIAFLAIEGLKHPHPRMRMTNVRGIMDTAVVLGFVLGFLSGSDEVRMPAIVVPPNKHGSGPLGAYPSALVGPRESAAGTGQLRHCRSAWDVAAAAVTMARWSAAR